MRSPPFDPFKKDFVYQGRHHVTAPSIAVCHTAAIASHWAPGDANVFVGDVTLLAYIDYENPHHIMFEFYTISLVMVPIINVI